MTYRQAVESAMLRFNRKDGDCINILYPVLSWTKVQLMTVLLAVQLM